jgi:dUTP pyrophosphatase
MKLLIKPFSQKIKLIYSNHGHFHHGDAGIDLYTIEKQVFRKKETDKIHFGIACENLDSKPYLLIPRSSISRTPLRMSNSIGLIDGGYRGEIMASVDNISDRDYTVNEKKRLFQLVSMQGDPINIELVDNLTATTRGSGGFGSTGE